MLDRLGISLKDKLKTMSKGTKEKVQLILVMSRNAQLYLLDEPIGGGATRRPGIISCDTIITQLQRERHRRHFHPPDLRTWKRCWTRWSLFPGERSVCSRRSTISARKRGEERRHAFQGRYSNVRQAAQVRSSGDGADLSAAVCRFVPVHSHQQDFFSSSRPASFPCRRASA